MADSATASLPLTTRLAQLRSQLQTLDALASSGDLGPTAHTEARAPLEREIVALVLAGDASLPPVAASADAVIPGSGGQAATTVDVSQRGAASAPPARPSARLLALLGVAVLGLACAGYALTGAPGLAWLQAFGTPPAGEPSAGQSAGGQPEVTREQIEAMVDKLAQRMKDRPDDAQGWLMLARSYSVLGRADDALPAYARAASLRPDDATTLADYADAIALHNGGRADTQSNALVAKALQLEPKNPKALALAGTAAFERDDYAGAVREWQKMADALPPDDPDRPRVLASIAEAKQRGKLDPAPTAGGVTGGSTGGTPAGTGIAMPSVPPAIADAAPTSATPAAPAFAAAPERPSASIPGTDTAITGRVALAPALAARAGPDDTVFIFARAAQGPRMPLAVLRARVKDLPLNYRLDDSMAMAPNAKLSGASQVIVGARVSKSGNAMPQAGDLAGESAPVAPGARDISITISQAVGP